MSGSAAALPSSDAVRRSGLALAVAGAVAFSGKAILVKLSYRYGVDAVTVIMLRMLFALPLFALLAWWGGRGRLPLQRRDVAAILGLGFCGYYLASFLDFLGLQTISAGLERLVLYLNPTLVLLLGWWLFGRRPVARQAGALALSYAGVALVFGQEVGQQGPQAAWGAFLVFASALSYAVYLLYSGEVLKRIGALRLTGLATSVACGLCIAQFVILRPGEGLLAAPGPVLGLAMLNAVLCTFLPVLMVMLAIERIGPVATAQAGMVGPLSTVAMAALLLDEPFTWVVALGTAMVLAGIAWLARAR